MAIIRTKTTHTRPPGVAIRAWRTITKAAHVAQGLAWVTRFLPLHFASFAAAKYGYKRRSPNYLAREKREVTAGIATADAARPLIHFGLLRHDVSAAAQIRGFPSRVKITLNGPSYLTMRPRDGRHPDMAAEIFAVTPGEQRELETILDAEITAGLNRINQPETVTT